MGGGGVHRARGFGERRMKDIRGRNIEPGDLVACAAADGRSSVLRIGRVLSVEDKTDEYYGYDGKVKVRVEDMTHTDRAWREVPYETTFHFGRRMVVLER